MPRKKDDPQNNKYLCYPDVCCRIDTGYHFCAKTTFFSANEHDMS